MKTNKIIGYKPAGHGKSEPTFKCCFCGGTLSKNEIINNSVYDYREMLCDKCVKELNIHANNPTTGLVHVNPYTPN